MILLSVCLADSKSMKSKKINVFQGRVPSQVLRFVLFRIKVLTY